MSVLTKFLQVNVRMSAVPSTTTEVHYLYNNFAKLNNITQFRYHVIDAGKPSMRYPQNFQIIYECHPDDASRTADTVRRLVALPRLQYYESLFENGNTQRHSIDNLPLTSATKDFPFYLRKESEFYEKLHPQQYFRIFTKLLSFEPSIDLNINENQGNDKKDISTKIDLKTHGFLNRNFGNDS